MFYIVCVNHKISYFSRNKEVEKLDEATRWWLHVMIEGAGILLAAAVAYGIVK
jgi:hypothetical protein